MRPLWHPVSAVFLAEPPVAAGVPALRLLLRAGPLALRYAGDRMSPAVVHGQAVTVRPLTGGVERGAVVLADVGAVPDLLRVTDRDGATLRLAGDADPSPGPSVPASAILGTADLAARRVSRGRRTLRRLLLDVREACRGAAEAEDGADVRSKYDAQAPFYAASELSVDPGLLERARRAFAPGGRVLVAGSGVGTECFALAAAGYEVRGLDFAPGMVRAARAEAQRRGLRVAFEERDLREHDEAATSLAGILFTYDVYSFLPDPQDRVALLRRMAGWVAPGGAILVSARRAEGAWARAVLTLQWLAGGARRPWGASHTRWIAADGRVRRSFVQVFPWRALRREWRAAGLEGGEWQGGHGQLTARTA